MEKNMFPGTSLSPVLMKHQVPGHWRVYLPTPAMGSKAKIKTRHHMIARVNLVTLVFMWLEYQCGFVMAMALSIAITLAMKREQRPKVVIHTPKNAHNLLDGSMFSHFMSAWMRARELPTMPVTIIVMGNPTDTDLQESLFVPFMSSRNCLETFEFRMLSPTFCQASR
ncbi:hypothetical protein NHX12_033470 [Muraenolepis orangiensis]|uniref:Uncharacterized protein n=1 Tax=Muraenolepis orangiensis TaxID=630683 RepID=A0A9Q0E627_9TELE|nr:hypothetical protein NHX12_033470 [Muraenolepis orangiensis]